MRMVLFAGAMALTLVGPTLDAKASEASSVLVVLPSASLDWTTLQLEVSASSHLRRGAWQDRRVQEQDALDNLAPRLVELARTIQVFPDQTVAELVAEGGEVSQRLEAGLRAWWIEETRYLAKGGVEMDAVLDIQDLLRPALLHRANASPPQIDPGGPTGLVIDARGIPYAPCLAPVVTTSDGSLLISADKLARDTAQVRAPVLYVRDPADPRAMERAGAQPLFGKAIAVKDGVLVLDSAASGPLVAHAGAPALVADGRVVLVVDPPESP